MNEKKTYNTTLIILILISMILFISNLQSVILPFNKINNILNPIYIGFILAFLLNPIMKIFERKVFYKINKPKCVRSLSILMSFILVIGVITGFMFIVIPQIKDSINTLITEGPGYIDKLILGINNIMSKLPVKNDNLLTLENILGKFLKIVSDFSSSIANVIFSTVSSLITVLKNILVAIFVCIYVLLSKERLVAGSKRVIKAFLSESASEKTIHYLRIANKKLGGYVLGNSLDCLMIGIISFTVFSIFGIPYPALIALIVGTTNFIPFFGPFIGGIPSAFIILIADPTKVISFLIIILIMQQIDGNLIQPKIIGDRTGLSSLGVIFAITLMGGIFGFVGLVIGAPLMSMFILIMNDYINIKLQRKNLPTDLSEYYNENDIIKHSDGHDEHFVNKIWKKFVAFIIKNNNVDENNDKTEND